MAVNPNNLLGQSNPNGTVGVSLGIDPAGANEAFSAGATSGFYVTPTSPAGMSVEVGGAVGVVDSALVRSASGITFPVGNVTGTPITLTVPAAPSTNSRIDSVVLYVDTSATATLTDGADAVGIEIVSGTSASTPVAPTDAQIRAAITNGAAIAYTVLADITVSSSTTTITASNISQANRAQLGADKIDFATIVACPSNDITCASQAYTTLSMGSTWMQHGNLSISGGKVVIGSGISRVMFSASAYISNAVTASSVKGAIMNLYINKNSTSGTVLSRSVVRTGEAPYFTIECPAKTIAVQEGDSLIVQLRNQSNSNVTVAKDASSTFLSVTAIG